MTSRNRLLRDVVRKGGAYAAIARQPGGGASFDFQNIADLFAGGFLELLVYARGDAVATQVSLRIQYNGDTGNRYYDQRLYGTAATAVGDEALAQASGRIGLIPAATALGSLYGTSRVLIPNYASAAAEKSAIASFAHQIGVSTGQLFTGQHMVLWDSTAPINRITIFPSAGAFTVDSYATLVGIPGGA